MQLHTEGPTPEPAYSYASPPRYIEKTKIIYVQPKTRSITDIGQSLINGVIGRNGNDYSTGEECVMRAMITAGVVTMITDFIHFHRVRFDLKAESAMALLTAYFLLLTVLCS